MLPGPAPLDPTAAPAPAADGCPSAAATPPRHRLAVAVAAATGNRCGHVPSAPRFHLLNLPENANHARPLLINQALLEVKVYYEAPRAARWDPLSQGERHARLERALAAAGGPDTEEGRKLAVRLERWRQQRSERREAVVSVLLLLLAYTDIDTLTIGIPSGGGWLGLSVAWIAERTGLSASRAKRALLTLHRAGLLTRTGAGRRFDARRRRWVGAGWGPVRRLSYAVVRMIGLDVRWQQEQRRRRKERARQARAAEAPTPLPPRTAAAAGREQVRALRQIVAPAVAPPADAPAAAARTRRAAELAAQGLSIAEIRQRLNDAPQPP